MKIIFIGDVVGKSGREAIKKNFLILKEKYVPDVIIVNAENSASGYGLTKKIALELFDLGVDYPNWPKDSFGVTVLILIYSIFEAAEYGKE